MNILSAFLQGVVDKQRSSYIVFIAPPYPEGEITQAVLTINNTEFGYYNDSPLTDNPGRISLDEKILCNSYEEAYDQANNHVYEEPISFANMQKAAHKFLKDQELIEKINWYTSSSQEESDRRDMASHTAAYPQN